MKSPRQAAPRVLFFAKKPKTTGAYDQLCDDLVKLRSRRASKVSISIKKSTAKRT
jgi:hypothetical protein